MGTCSQNFVDHGKGKIKCTWSRSVILFYIYYFQCFMSSCSSSTPNRNHHPPPTTSPYPNCSYDRDISRQSSAVYIGHIIHTHITMYRYSQVAILGERRPSIAANGGNSRSDRDTRNVCNIVMFIV